MNLIDSLWTLTSALRKEYLAFFNQAQIVPESVKKVDDAYKKLLAGKFRYESVVRTFNKAGIPWYLIGVLHMRESTFNFTRHLHEGSPLTGRTKNVPQNRPKANPIAGPGKPYTWEESATDCIAFMLEGNPAFSRGVNDGSTESLLNKIEAFNGTGYRSREIPSPYLWADSTVERVGKFIADGRFDAKADDKQTGAGTLLKYFLEMEAKKKEKPST